MMIMALLLHLYGLDLGQTKLVFDPIGPIGGHPASEIADERNLLSTLQPQMGSKQEEHASIATI